MFCGFGNHLPFQRVTTGCLCAESPENDRVELSDTLAATRWPGSSTIPAGPGTGAPDRRDKRDNAAQSPHYTPSDPLLSLGGFL